MRAAKRPFTEKERETIQALTRVNFRAHHWPRRFVYDIARMIESGESVTEGQAAQIILLNHQFRHQLRHVRNRMAREDRRRATIKKKARQLDVSRAVRCVGG